MPTITYVDEGFGEVILFLHGWGQNKEMMLPLIEELKCNYRCIVLDLPGFGESPFNDAETLNLYTEKLNEFLKGKGIKPTYIVGHSFGGKVAVNYILKYGGVKGLILLASPILKPKRTVKYFFNIYKYKFKKKLNLAIKEYGSYDYKNCSKNMKSFFVNVVNTHFDKSIRLIESPVLLIWGNKDDKVPLSKAKLLNKKLKNSKLYIQKGGHFAYLENIEFTRLIIQQFIRGYDND